MALERERAAMYPCVVSKGSEKGTGLQGKREKEREREGGRPKRKWERKSVEREIVRSTRKTEVSVTSVWNWFGRMWRACTHARTHAYSWTIENSFGARGISSKDLIIEGSCSRKLILAYSSNLTSIFDDTHIPRIEKVAYEGNVEIFEVLKYSR